MALHEALGAGCQVDRHGRDPRGTGRRPPRADHRRDRVHRLPHRRRPGRGVDRHAPFQRIPRRAFVSLGRERRTDRRAHGPGRQCNCARAHRRGGCDHSLQFPLHAQHREGGAGSGRRLHGGAQAAPLDAMLIAEVAAEAGIPPGVLNVITGHGEVGDELTSNPMVDMVTFTGSTATGRRIMASASGTVKRVQLELGGKSATVVLGDVGEDYARSVGFGQVLMHCGQGCVLHTRLLLPEHLLGAYKEGLDAMRPMITIGDPRNESTVLGPLIREQQRERVEGYVASGLEQGAELLCGGKRPEGMEKGYYYEPTVFVSSNDLRIAQEEIFGPVLTVVPYSGEDEDAVRLANDSIYGLGGGVVSTSDSRGFNVARRIRAGLVTVQKVGTESLADVGPGGGQGPGWGSEFKGIGQGGAFGGYKQSGLGREWGRHGLEDFTEVKNLAWS